MSLTLNRVELFNFRSHEHFVFAPKLDGITAICGKNGVGKSSVINAISFALFGPKTLGVKRMSHLARYGISKDDECRVVVELTIDGVSLKIERRLVGSNHNSAECDVWERAADSEPWQHVAGPSPTFSSTYIKKRLGMDEKGFIAAVLVPQKQVDSLITASRNERGAVIEKLTGVSSLTRALEKAREQHREAKKVAQALDVDPTEVSALQAELDKALQEVGRLEKKNAQHRAKVQDSLKAAGVAKEKRDRLKREYDKSVRLVQQVERETSLLEHLKDELARAKEEKDAQRQRVLSLGSAESVSEIEAQARQVRARLVDSQSELKAKRLELQRGEDLIQRAEKFLTHYGLPFDVGGLEDELAECENRLEGIEQAQSQLQAQVLSLDEQRKKVLKAAATLEKNSGCCPTCLQQVQDTTAVVATLKSQAEELEEKSKLARGQFEVGEQARIEDAKRLKMLPKAIEAANAYEKASASTQALTEQIRGLETDVESLSPQVEQIDARLTKARGAAREKEAYEKLHANVLRLSEGVSEREQNIDALKSELKQLRSPSESAVEQAQASADKANDKLLQAKDVQHESASDLLKAQGQVRALEDDLEAGEEALAVHKNALANCELARASEEVVATFRQERIDKAIPQITSIASELISQFTDGRFVAIEMTSTFIPSVVDSAGRKIEVSSLSGGEMSAAALALRTAISIVLSGGASGLIILDEVLVSQDLERSANILYAIKEACKGQVILIAHSTIVEDVADEIVSIV